MFSAREIVKLVMTICFVFLLLQFTTCFHMNCTEVCANLLVYFCTFLSLIFNKKLDLLFASIMFISSCFILPHCANSLFWYAAGVSVLEFPRLQRLLVASICFFSIHSYVRHTIKCLNYYLHVLCSFPRALSCHTAPILCFCMLQDFRWWCFLVCSVCWPHRFVSFRFVCNK